MSDIVGAEARRVYPSQIGWSSWPRSLVKHRKAVMRRSRQPGETSRRSMSGAGGPAGERERVGCCPVLDRVDGHGGKTSERCRPSIGVPFDHSTVQCSRFVRNPQLPSPRRTIFRFVWPISSRLWNNSTGTATCYLAHAAVEEVLYGSVYTLASGRQRKRQPRNPGSWSTW